MMLCLREIHQRYWLTQSHGFMRHIHYFLQMTPVKNQEQMKMEVQDMLSHIHEKGMGFLEPQQPLVSRVYSHVSMRAWIRWHDDICLIYLVGASFSPE